jgi:hypothetical protein
MKSEVVEILGVFPKSTEFAMSPAKAGGILIG